MKEIARFIRRVRDIKSGYIVTIPFTYIQTGLMKAKEEYLFIVLPKETDVNLINNTVKSLLNNIEDKNAETTKDNLPNVPDSNNKDKPDILQWGMQGKSP